LIQNSTEESARFKKRNVTEEEMWYENAVGSVVTGVRISEKYFSY